MKKSNVSFFLILAVAGMSAPLDCVGAGAGGMLAIDQDLHASPAAVEAMLQDSYATQETAFSPVAIKYMANALPSYVKGVKDRTNGKWCIKLKTEGKDCSDATIEVHVLKHGD